MKDFFVRRYRSAILILLFVLFGLGALFMKYLLFPFQKSKIQNYELLQKSWKFLIFLLKALGLISLEIDNIKQFENIRNSIVVSTHPSFADIVILISLIPHSTCFVAKRLARNPYLKDIVKRLFILEGQDMNQWIKEASDVLNEGLNVIIFPMGIRHRKNEYPRIRRGAGLIAEKTGANITMIRIEQSQDFLQIHQPFYDAGDRTIEYTIEYLGEINTNEYLKNYPDKVFFKTQITKKISQTLYKK